MKKEHLIANLTIIYFVTGLLFATAFAIYYHWPVLSFLSPGFYAVVISWPLQITGFLSDLQTYGFAGKPI